MDLDGLLRLAVPVAVVGLCIGAAEWADPETERRPRDRAETRRHLWWMAAYLVVAPLTGWVAARVIGAADQRTPLADLVGNAPFVVRLLLAVLLADTAAYWLHRAMHASGVLWRLHRVHHRATDVRWWTAFRFHPLDTLLAHTVPYAVATVAGVGLDAVGGYVLAVMVVTLWAHADVYVPGAWLRRVVVTPGYHRRHHEVDGERSNYALVLPLLDLVFRTAWFRVGAARRFGTTVS